MEIYPIGHFSDFNSFINCQQSVEEKSKICAMGGENIGKILLLSFEDEEDEMIKSVLTALEIGRKGYQIIGV